MLCEKYYDACALNLQKQTKWYSIFFNFKIKKAILVEASSLNKLKKYLKENQNRWDCHSFEIFINKNDGIVHCNYTNNGRKEIYRPN